MEAGSTKSETYIIISYNFPPRIIMPSQVRSCRDRRWRLGGDLFWGRQQDAIARERWISGLVLFDRGVQR